jgi:hypothetical protein
MKWEIEGGSSPAGPRLERGLELLPDPLAVLRMAAHGRELAHLPTQHTTERQNIPAKLIRIGLEVKTRDLYAVFH